MDTSAVRAVLAGEASYDSLGDEEQAQVRAAWAEQMSERLANLDLEPDLRAAHVPWVVGDADGKAVRRG